MTPREYTVLRAKAEGATPGPWYASANYLIGGIWVHSSQYDPERSIVFDMVVRAEDAAFIVAANPQAVLALLAEIEQQRRLLLDTADERDQLQQQMPQAQKRIAELEAKNKALMRHRAATEGFDYEQIADQVRYSDSFSRSDDDR